MGITHTFKSLRVSNCRWPFITFIWLCQRNCKRRTRPGREGLWPIPNLLEMFYQPLSECGGVDSVSQELRPEERFIINRPLNPVHQLRFWNLFFFFHNRSWRAESRCLPKERIYLLFTLVFLIPVVCSNANIWKKEENNLWHRNILISVCSSCVIDILTWSIF